MKKILILFEGKTEGKKPFGKNDGLRKVYEQLFRVADKKKLRLYRAGIENFRNGRFSRAWIYKKKWVKLKNIVPDLVFDKCTASEKWGKIKLEIQRQLRVINHPGLSKITDDKALTAKLFPGISPRTFLLKNNEEFKKKLKKIRTRKMVVKPLSCSGGAGIRFLDKNRQLKKPTNIRHFPAVLQEFIDTSSGIKGMAKGTHDLRAVIMNGKIHHALLRLAKKGSFFCNISKGAKERYLPKQKIPSSVKTIIKKIDSRLRKYGKRFYSIDFMIDERQRPWLVELNSRPGIYGYTETNGYPKNFQEKFLSDIISLLKSR